MTEKKIITPTVGRKVWFRPNGTTKLQGGAEMCMPGDNVAIEVELQAPIAMEEKLRFAIREGGKTVGSGVVTKILE